MTDDQSASVSWNKATIWGLRPDFVNVRQLRVCWCGALSLTSGRVCRLQLLLTIARAVILGSESRGTRENILLYQIRDFPLRHLLRPAASRWRYSTPPPHGIDLVLIWTAAYIAYDCWMLDYTERCLYRVGLQESTCMETCQRVPLAIRPHVTTYFRLH
jgi:hypothetical protein